MFDLPNMATYYFSKESCPFRFISSWNKQNTFKLIIKILSKWFMDYIGYIDQAENGLCYENVFDGTKSIETEAFLELEHV